MTMTWIMLVVAGLFEVAWASGMKYSQGFTRLGWSVFTVVTALFSFGLLMWAMKQLPLGTAYAVWVGIGVLGAFCVGIVWLGEPVTWGRVLSAGCILVGVIGLKLAA